MFRRPYFFQVTGAEKQSFFFYFLFFFGLEMSKDRDFEIGNLPEGLNVAPSSGAPKHLNTVSLDLKQDVNQFGLAGKIWQR